MTSEQKCFKHRFVNPLYYPHLLFMSFVTNVADICRRHVLILALGKLDHFSLPSLIKIIHIQSIHALVILISSCSRHQPQSSLV
jgi:hypothetical protein